MTPREQVIETIARACCLDDGYNPDFLIAPQDNDIDRMWMQYKTTAGVILTALEQSGYIVRPREATERMQSAVEKYLNTTTLHQSTGHWYIHCDTAMTSVWEQESHEDNPNPDYGNTKVTE